MNNKTAIELLQLLDKTIDEYTTDVDGLLGEDTSDIDDIAHQIAEAFTKRNLSSKFDIPVREIHISSRYWYNVYTYPETTHIGMYGKGRGEISWPDGGEQPNNEWLYVVKFPTGAYIFGEGYPTEVFNTFFNELKGFNPKYIDTANSALYFDGKNAGEVYSNLKDIYLKYKAEVQKELDRKRIAKLKAELEKLEGSGE